MDAPPTTTPRPWPGFLRAIGLGNREQFSWALYDWANSGFATTTLGTVFPLFFVAVAREAGFDANTPTVLYAYLSAIALLITALAGPILGSIADYAGVKKRFVAVFTAIGVAGCIAMVFIGTGDWVYAGVVFVIANIGFGGALIFYDALLPHVANREQIDRVSTAGYALGYFGGGVLLVVNVAWLLAPTTFGFPDTLAATKASLASVAIWWTVFAIPLFVWVREPKRRLAANESPGANPVTAGFGRLIGTLRSIAGYRNVFIFLLAFWLYNDGINTIIRMATVFGAEVGIGTNDLIIAFVITQFLGIPFAFAFGPLAARIGQKNAIYLALGIYTLISIGGFFLTNAVQFFLLAAAVATVQGGSQAISRSLFSTMIPRAQSSEFFGFFSVSSKFAGILGPLIFAIVSQVMGTSRLSIIALVVFFVSGMILLRFVDIDAGQRRAREEDALFEVAPGAA